MESKISVSIDKEKLNSDTKWDRSKGYKQTQTFAQKKFLKITTTFGKLKKPLGYPKRI